jgi:hypothetical protein
MYIYTYIRTYIHTYIRIIHTYDTHIHTYLYIYIHTYTHTLHTKHMKARVYVCVYSKDITTLQCFTRIVYIFIFQSKTLLWIQTVRLQSAAGISRAFSCTFETAPNAWPHLTGKMFRSNLLLN